MLDHLTSLYDGAIVDLDVKDIRDFSYEIRDGHVRVRIRTKERMLEYSGRLYIDELIQPQREETNEEVAVSVVGRDARAVSVWFNEIEGRSEVGRT